MKILIVQPSWVGDAVMATPTLRAIRQLYPQARITYLMRRYVKPLYRGMPWADRLLSYRQGKTAKLAGVSTFKLICRLRKARFDMAVLLPNSFRTALICKLAGIPRIVGYRRDGRGLFLTDKLEPLKEGRRFIPSPIIKSYLALAQHLGHKGDDLAMQLFVTPGDLAAANAVLQRCGLDPAIYRPGQSTGQPLVLLNPGAQYGAAKCWLTENFAAVADRLIEERNATVLISAAPRERMIVEEILASMKHRAIDLASHGLTLGSLKEITRRCDLMITNDTGPRHIAAAMGIPVITIFGPTFPEWTEIYYPHERQLMVKVPCGPCQRKICPLDHRCMTQITPAQVLSAAAQFLPARPDSQTACPPPCPPAVNN